MSPSPAPTQSATERRAAEARLRELIEKFAPAHLRLIDTVRRWLRNRLPTAFEVVYEYSNWLVISWSPNERGYEGVFAVRADEEGVTLYFNQGKELPDPEKLLTGAGKQVRGLHLESPSTLARPAVVRLFEEAMARNPVPFARTGRGPVILRPATGKKGPRRPTA